MHAARGHGDPRGWARVAGAARPMARAGPGPCGHDQLAARDRSRGSSLALPHRLALAEERRDAFGRILEREHAPELGLQIAELRPELHVLRAIERLEPERECGRAAIGEL